LNQRSESTIESTINTHQSTISKETKDVRRRYASSWIVLLARARDDGSTSGGRVLQESVWLDRERAADRSDRNLCHVPGARPRSRRRVHHASGRAAARRAAALELVRVRHQRGRSGEEGTGARRDAPGAALRPDGCGPRGG